MENACLVDFYALKLTTISSPPRFQLTSGTDLVHRFAVLQPTPRLVFL